MNSCRYLKSLQLSSLLTAILAGDRLLPLGGK